LQDFEEELNILKKRYPDATHHCTAYRVLGEQILEFSNDDGESSGSAGLPILNALRSSELVNCGVDVVRYYGGTKLGKSGLIEAYGETAKGCIEFAELATIQKMARVQVFYQYHQEKEIQPLVRNLNLVEEESEFLESVSKMFLCPIELEASFLQSLEKLEYLGIKFDSIEHTFVMI
jgi:uncharacterized YigZ family protein